MPKTAAELRARRRQLYAQHKDEINAKRRARAKACRESLPPPEKKPPMTAAERQTKKRESQKKWLDQNRDQVNARRREAYTKKTAAKPKRVKRTRSQKNARRRELYAIKKKAAAKANGLSDSNESNKITKPKPFFTALKAAAKDALADGETSPIMGRHKFELNKHIGQEFPPDEDGNPLKIYMREGTAYNYGDRGLLRLKLTNGQQFRIAFAEFGGDIHFQEPILE